MTRAALGCPAAAGGFGSGEERAHGVTIDQRDAARVRRLEAYLVVTGQPPEWSNRFGYREGA